MMSLEPIALGQEAEPWGVCAFKETLQVVGRPRGAGTMGIWNDFLLPAGMDGEMEAQGLSAQGKRA